MEGLFPIAPMAILAGLMWIAFFIVVIVNLRRAKLERDAVRRRATYEKAHPEAQKHYIENGHYRR